MKKNTKVKGFTLVELIVVMAIFSIIMFGAIRVMNPLDKIVKHASMQEANSATVDNIKHYFEDSLRYAEHVEVYRGALVDENNNTITADDTSTADEEKAVVDFINRYYEDRVTADSSGNVSNLTGKVRMLKINNDADANGNYGVVSEYEWDFKAGRSYDQIDAADNVIATEAFHDSATLSNVKTINSVINNSYYDDYAFTFIPGFCETVGGKVQYVDMNNDGVSDSSDKDLSTKASFFSMSVVVNNKSDGKFDVNSDSVSATYMLSNINFSFVNINSGFVSTKFYYPVAYKESEGGAVSYDYLTIDGSTKTAGSDSHPDYWTKAHPNRTAIFREIADSDANYSDCIYFIYVLPNQM